MAVPQTINLSSPLADFNPQIQSVRAFLFPSSLDQTAEVAIAQCCFVLMDSFTGKNQTGTLLFHGFLDTGLAPIMAYYNVSTFQQLLTAVFTP